MLGKVETLCLEFSPTEPAPYPGRTFRMLGDTGTSYQVTIKRLRSIHRNQRGNIQVLADCIRAVSYVPPKAG